MSDWQMKRQLKTTYFAYQIICNLNIEPFRIIRMLLSWRILKSLHCIGWVLFVLDHLRVWDGCCELYLNSSSSGQTSEWREPARIFLVMLQGARQGVTYPSHQGTAQDMGLQPKCHICPNYLLLTFQPSSWNRFCLTKHYPDFKTARHHVLDTWLQSWLV